MKQPNSYDCFVCGLRNPFGLKLSFYNNGPGEVSANYTVPGEYQGYPGVVHGGIVAAMLDEICGRALMGGEQPRFMYTAKLEIRYRKNVPVKQPLRLVGKAGQRRGRMAEASGVVIGPDDELLAEAQAILVDVPDDVYANVDLDEIGWKVYPDDV